MSEFVDHVTALMRPWARICARRMFGGHGLFRDGLMFALASDDTLYLKADAETAPRFAAHGCAPFVYTAAARTVRLGYWTAPPECIESATDMEPWCALAWQAALRSQHAKLAGKTERPRKARAATGRTATRTTARKKDAQPKKPAPKR